MDQLASQPDHTPASRTSTATLRPFAIAMAGLTGLLLTVGAVAACSKSTPAEDPLRPVSTVTTVTSLSPSLGTADCSSSATCPDGRDKTGKKSSERGF